MKTLRVFMTRIPFFTGRELRPNRPPFFILTRILNTDLAS